MLLRIPFLAIYATRVSLAASSLVQRAAQSSNIPEISNEFVIPSNSTQATSSGTALPSLPSVISSGSLSNLSLATSNTSELVLNGTAAGLKLPAVVCDEEKGEGLTVQSCIQAYNVMTSYLTRLSHTRTKVTIGTRSQGIFDIPDRIRFLSPQGICAIDVGLAYDQADSTTTIELASAATALLNQCVEGYAEPQGGEIVSLGEKRQIDMEFHFNPMITLPQCKNPPPTGPPAQSCLSLLQSMPLGRSEQSFGLRGSNADVELPRALHGADGRCTLTLNTRGPIDWVTWDDIYEAVVEIDAICVRQGIRGVRANLGE
ncbi:hypothetical protein ABVK25_003599 [Lepraria finkii]|uniref:Uncharacterized protein n=1 Tax=Lepraria finkii TaxID=1340010 RepID=A0ABR4BDN3_9LECA